MPEHSHRYEFGAPRGGWPDFGPDGRLIRNEGADAEPVRCPSCGDVVATASPGARVQVDDGSPAEVSVDGEVVHTCGPSTT